MLDTVLEEGSFPNFNDPAYQRRLARAAQLSGRGRYLTYGKLELDMARNAAPLASSAIRSFPTSSPPRSGARRTVSTARTSRRYASNNRSGERLFTSRCADRPLPAAAIV